MVKVNIFHPQQSALRNYASPMRRQTNNNNSGAPPPVQSHQRKCSVSSSVMQQKPTNNRAGKLHTLLFELRKLMNQPQLHSSDPSTPPLHCHLPLLHFYASTILLEQSAHQHAARPNVPGGMAPASSSHLEWKFISARLPLHSAVQKCKLA